MLIYVLLGISLVLNICLYALGSLMLRAYRSTRKTLLEEAARATLWEEKARRYEAELHPTTKAFQRTNPDCPEEGELCPVRSCNGTIELPPVEGCYCHQVAPCSHCTSNHLCCNQCGWAEGDPLE